MSVQSMHTLLGEEGCQCKNKVDIHFQILIHFFITFVAYFPSKKLHFLSGRGSEKVYVLYPYLNINNFGWPLKFYAIYFKYYQSKLLKTLD